MEKGQNSYGGDGYYRITVADEGWGYYIMIASDKHNQFRSYEYDGACGTFEEVEELLKNSTFSDIVKRFKEEYVYLACVELLA